MKIERISENQIRCTLNKTDLADKELLLNELAYGTDKAKELFREMMMQASNELGFEVDDIPLMIEAIPVSPECLILIITKVEDPEELDTRFSRFSKPAEYFENNDDDDDLVTSTDSVIDSIEDIVNDIDKATQKSTASNQEFISLPESIKKRALAAQALAATAEMDIFKVFRFNSLSELEKVSALLQHKYDGDNSLYKNPENNKYYLIISRSSHSNDVFTSTCNLLSEYGVRLKTTYATPYHYIEHYRLIVKKNALQVLASL